MGRCHDLRGGAIRDILPAWLRRADDWRQQRICAVLCLLGCDRGAQRAWRAFRPIVPGAGRFDHAAGPRRLGARLHTDRGITPTFQLLPGASFVVNGAKLASDSARASAALELRWANGVSVAAVFDGEFSDVTRAYTGKGYFRYQW